MSYTLTHINLSAPYEAGILHGEQRSVGWVTQGTSRVRFGGTQAEVEGFLVRFLGDFHRPLVAAMKPEDFGCDGGDQRHATPVLEDLGRCDSCGREDGVREPSLAGWLCELCQP